MTKLRVPHVALLLILVLPLVLAACGGSSDEANTAAGSAPAVRESGPAISGRIEAGLRVLTFDPEAADQHFTIHRGDYVLPELSNGESFTLEIPSLDVDRQFPAAEDEKRYFKVPDTGSFAFRIGPASGVIEAVDYTAAQYREIGAREAAEMIANVHPFILDVRTPPEYAAGHIEGAVLIPVQQLQRRLGELSAHRQEPVFVYCASGNRSTVAAKLLVEDGFDRVVNLRHGIKEWNLEQLPTVK